MLAEKMLEEDLRREIRKWSQKLDDALQEANPATAHGVKMLDNIRAYRKDSRHFLEKQDLIKSFECLIWAWAMLEIGRELEHLKSN